MIRRPPRSTLFPYTRSSDLTGLNTATSSSFDITAGVATQLVFSTQPSTTVANRLITPAVKVRSEEHTSELQSQSNVVCRLLLEKKKAVVDDRPEDARVQTLS